MDIPLDEVLHFDATTSNPATGAVSDADSTPTWSIFEEDTDTAILSAQNFTKRTGLTGNYRGAATLSAGNGFEVGKWYNIIGSATVNSVAGKAVITRFRIVPAESLVGYPKVDLHSLKGVAQSGTDLADFADTGYDPATHKVETVKVADNMRGTDNAALAATALSTVQWTNARAGYLDNINVGTVASQADINALNQSASRRVILTTVQQYERPESGNSTYTIEARTYDGDGAAVNADTTPTLTATGIVSGSLAANLGAASNPAAGVYRWAYTVASSATIEQIQFDVSATISASTFTLSAYTQVVDEVSQTWTSTDAGHLTAIYNKLPTNNIADQTVLAAAIATTNVQTAAAAIREAVGLNSANLDTQLGDLPTNSELAAATIARVTLVDTTTALGSAYDAAKTAASAANLALLSQAVSDLNDFDPTTSGVFLVNSGLDLIPVTGAGSLTLPEVLGITAGVVAGKINDAGTGTETFKGLDKSTTVAVIEVETSGNRTDADYLP